MATARHANIELQPPRVEEQVTDYFRKLTEKLSVSEFTQDGSLQCIVFAEWGHGKSQTLYRTKEYIRRQHPNCPVITAVSANPTAILRAVIEQFPPTEHDIKSNLQKVKESIIRLDGDEQKMHKVATALAQTVDTTNHPHLVILFDEVQTISPKVFQHFLETLRDEFRGLQRCVHTMQCHSLSSIDGAQTIRKNLGEWLARAHAIQLPSLSPDDAHRFFTQRIADYGGDPEPDFVSLGISKTLCEMAGGNPRMMLILAQNILLRIGANGDPHKFTPEIVLETLKRQNGAVPNTPLVKTHEYQAIIDLLPQEWPQIGGRLAEWLKLNFAKLFVGRRTYDNSDLCGPPLNLDSQQLGTLQKRIYDTSLFRVETDEDLGTTEYQLSDQFRELISNAFGSSGGSLREKELQFNLVIQPQNYQRELTQGIRTILQAAKIDPRPSRCSMGEDDETERPFQGSVVNTHLRHDSSKEAFSHLFAPVLVTTLFGVKPSNSFCKVLREGLKNGKWLKAIIYFHHPDTTWDQWINTTEGHELLGDFRDKIAVLDNTHWGSFVQPPPTQNQDTPTEGIKALQFFAAVGTAVEMDPQSMNDHQRQLVQKMKVLFNERTVHLSEITYLPNELERTLIASNHWECQDSFTLADINTSTGGQWDRNRLYPLVYEYIGFERNKWKRRNWKSSKLYGATLKALKKSKSDFMTAQVISVRCAEDCTILPSQRTRMDTCVGWILDLMRVQGLVQEELRIPENVYRYVDLEGKLRTQKKDLTKRFKDLFQSSKVASNFNNDISKAIIEKANKIKEKLDRRISQESLARREEFLNDLSADVDEWADDLKKIEIQNENDRSECHDRISGLKIELIQIRQRIPTPLVETVFPDEEWNELNRSIKQFLAEMSGDIKDSKSLAETNRAEVSLRKRIQHHIQILEGTKPLPGSDKSDCLLSQLLSNPSWSRIEVTWRQSQ